MLIALVAMGVQVLLHSLDRPWLKRRIVDAVRGAAGVDIDYRTARVDLLTGADIEDLVVRSPQELRSLAPDLARVGRVVVQWSPGSLVSGRRPRIQRVAVSDVALTVATDERGRTSLDALARPGAASQPGPSTPLSRVASTWLAAAPLVGELDVDHVTFAWVRADGQAPERTELRGLAVGLVVRPAAPQPGWRVDANLGTTSAPLRLELTQVRAGGEERTARAALWLMVSASPGALSAAVDLRMLDQTFAANVQADRWLHAEARARFDPTAGTTDITIDPLEAADGAVTAQASLELPDHGDPVVQRARGDVDLARLLRWVPADLLPVTAERAQVRWELESLVATAASLPEKGALRVEADLSNVVVQAAGGPFEVGAGGLSLRAQPTARGGIAAHGSLELAGARLGPAHDGVTADGVALEFDGERSTGGAVAGSAELRFERLERGGALPLASRDGRLEVHVDGLQADLHEPLATRGDVSLSLQLSSLDARLPGTHVTAEGLAVRAHTALEGHAPYALALEAPVSHLHVVGRHDEVLADAAARVEVHARDLEPDLARPVASRGVVSFLVDVGDVQASLDATKGADTVDYGLRATAHSLAAVRPLLPAAWAASVPWERMTAAVRSSGHLENLRGAAPSLRQTTELQIDHPAFAGIAARSLSLTVKSQGTALRHEADVDLRAPGLAIDGGSPSDDHLTLSATVDRQRPSLQLRLASEGRAATNVTGSLFFDRPRRTLEYDVEGHLGGLAALAPFAARVRGLDAFDLSQLEISASARGALSGVLSDVGTDGSVRLEPQPARTARVEGSVDLRVAHLRWARGDTAIITPALAWHADVRGSGPGPELLSRLDVGTLHLDVGSHDVDLDGLHDEGNVSLRGDLSDPDVQATQRLTIGAVEQDLVPEYPMGDITLALSAERSPEGMVHISEANLTNGRAGSSLTVDGNVDLGEGRRTLSIRTSLAQDLSRLSTIPERFKGRGKLTVQASVDSPDLARYTVRSVVKGEDVDVALPRDGVEVASANGEVPITASLEVGEKGVALERTERTSPYSMLRFADQHPLLAHSGFLTIARLETPFVTVAPLVGNLEIEQNVVSLRQFEMGVRGGTITGQCGLDWDGPRSTLELHVRASGVQSSHGEPFDGNISVIVSAADHTIEGRAEILRIGERHLLDLLDLQDPLHVDPAMNRIRTALHFGYPDSLHLLFDHGFASAHLELGGLARLVRISDLRGIPIGPIVDRMIAPVLAGADAKEAP